MSISNLFTNRFRQTLSMLLAFSLLSLTVGSGAAQAALIPTSELQRSEQLQYDRQALVELLAQEDVQGKLLALGVDPADAKQRVNHLTADELVQLNGHISELPAGSSSVAGVILTVFIVFVITDALGATDIFSFVDPIT